MTNLQITTPRSLTKTDTYQLRYMFKEQLQITNNSSDDDKQDADDIIDCSVSTVQKGAKKLRLPGDHHPLGKISVKKVVQKSSNRGAAQLGIHEGSGPCACAHQCQGKRNQRIEKQRQ